MILKIFTQPNCSKCPAAKKLACQLTVRAAGIASGDARHSSRRRRARFTVEEYDVSTVDGMAEGAFYSMMATPSLILVNDKGKVVAEWRGKVPSRKEIEKFLISNCSN